MYFAGKDSIKIGYMQIKIVFLQKNAAGGCVLGVFYCFARFRWNRAKAAIKSTKNTNGTSPKGTIYGSGGSVPPPLTFLGPGVATTGFVELLEPEEFIFSQLRLLIAIAGSLTSSETTNCDALTVRFFFVSVV